MLHGGLQFLRVTVLGLVALLTFSCVGLFTEKAEGADFGPYALDYPFTFTITGTVRDTTGRPVPRIQPRAMRGQIEIDQSPSNQDGFYSATVTVNWPNSDGTVGLGFEDDLTSSEVHDPYITDLGWEGETLPESGIADSNWGVFVAYTRVTPSPGAVITHDPVLRQRSSGQPAAGAINMNDRRAVQAAYNRIVRQSRIKANVSAPGCEPGVTPPRVQQATINVVNTYRAMAGMAPVALDPNLSATAQAAAVIMAKNKALTHFPGKRMKCWSAAGADGAKNSNLALGRGVNAGDGVSFYMLDPGWAPPGHRSGVLKPSLTAIGTGDYGQANALNVQSQQTHEPPFDARELQPWPAAGWFPEQFQRGAYWSLIATTDNISFEGVSMRIYRGKKPLIARFANSFPTHIAFEMKQAPKWAEMTKRGPINVTVELKGIRYRGVVQPTYRYTVRLFKP